ncbi:SRPBCC family protein [Williamsia muralis]|uniref:Polyketide cyclase n=1 Tax=Williamsia marianensis TaxID=85044 RepID=A0A2G3PJ75_WILMA|nr:SRPBCC domain-containing protein [Williamsia marianensis]PHV65850.1 polyketide cyclase [Williamsia marianensis]
MTETTVASIKLDQFVQAEPRKVWRTLTEPELLEKWWVPGDISAEVGHEFTLEMPGFGRQPCKILRSEPFSLLSYSFTPQWTLTWTLVPEGRGTRLLLEHSGFDLDDARMAAAFDRMGPGWQGSILPLLAETAQSL